MLASIVAFFRRPQNLPVIVIPLLLLTWGRFIAPELGAASFENVALFNSPYRETLPLSEMPIPVEPPTAEHVVIVVIDGLRLDVSRQLPAINGLRAQGADRAIQVGQPSFSLPGWTVIGTGAWQEQSGFTTNYTTESIPLDTLFTEAKRAGLTMAIVGSTGWGQLYASGVDTLRLKEENADEYVNLTGDLQFDQEMADSALDVLQDQPNLMLIHLLSTDSAGHGWGGTSPEYLQAAQNADSLIARILEAINLSDTAVFVTADHGHIDRGGHGGWEPVVLEIPLVSAGVGIRAGEYPQAQQSAIAPTVAALLGLAIPAHNQGVILFDQLDLPAAVAATRAVDLAAQITRRYDSMLQTIGDARRVDPQLLESVSRSAAGDTDAAIASVQALVDSANAQWNAARNDRMNRERLSRIPAALVVLVIIAAYLWWWRRERWNWRAPLIGAIVYFVVWNAIYFVIHGYTYSISMFNKEDEVVAFITGRVIEAVIALTLAIIVVAILRRRAAPGEIARDAVHTMLLVVIVLGVQIVAFYVWWDFLPTWYLPDLYWGFKFYLDLFQTTVFWPLLFLPLAALLPLIAIGVGWIARRLAPGRTAV